MLPCLNNYTEYFLVFKYFMCRSLFWKEEMELTLVGMQNSGKTTFVNVLAVSVPVLNWAQCALKYNCSHFPALFLIGYLWL